MKFQEPLGRLGLRFRGFVFGLVELYKVSGLLGFR